MKIHYNAPFVLTYTIICLAVVVIDNYVNHTLCQNFFSIAPIGYLSFKNPVTYFRLFSHAIGHADFQHFIGNFSFILLIGPVLEEKYGTKKLITLSLLTALLTGILHAFFFNSLLLGASGIVFMMILLASFTNMKRGIPLTFILVVMIFLGQEVLKSFGADNVSQFAHIIGGICGGVFGYVLGGGKKMLNPSNESPMDKINNKDDDSDGYVDVI